MSDYIKSLLENAKGYTKIYSSSVDGFNGDIFREKCKNYLHTLTISKSNFGKILGGYLPMKWTKFSWTKVTGGDSFVFFFD